MSGIQEDGTIDEMEAFADDENLTQDQVDLLREIAEKFSVEDSAADLSILYEVTGYQAESQNFEFWENYQDFEEQLGDTNLVRNDKNEENIKNDRSTVKISKSKDRGGNPSLD